jgi:DNA-directed RNA polymerase subunit alpha
MGYVSAEENSTNEVGVIPLDSSYSPVVRANYVVEAARVGRSSNFDKVKLTLTTNGTMTPENAIRESAKILTNYFGFVNSETAYTADEKVKSSKETSGFVDDLDLPTRVLNALRKSGINKLSDLKSLSLADLKKVKNLGEKSALQVVEKAAEKGVIIE